VYSVLFLWWWAVLVSVDSLIVYHYHAAAVVNNLCLFCNGIFLEVGGVLPIFILSFFFLFLFVLRPPQTQPIFELANGMLIPLVGLGTGTLTDPASRCGTFNSLNHKLTIFISH
jgi:hypothetical protein